MVMERYEFLRRLHEIVKPQTYLEIGVQHGNSLRLALHPGNDQLETAIGIDPSPLLGREPLTKLHPKVRLKMMTSDQFFSVHHEDLSIDLAFIDGMHLVEFAYRDLCNVLKYSHRGTVIAIDDVLPTTQTMAAREQCPGDWTGDVWKLLQPDVLSTRWVYLADTAPTGILVIANHRIKLDDFRVPVLDTVPDWILDRRDALDPEYVLAAVAVPVILAKKAAM